MDRREVYRFGRDWEGRGVRKSTLKRQHEDGNLSWFVNAILCMYHVG